MCGIAGYFGEGSVDTLKSMKESLRHRGPDDNGEIQIDNVGLAHTRLSIIDLTDSGHQPMQNHKKTLSIVFNGEIYNYKELKEEFLKDYKFVGTSDTEVLLYLYEELGEKFLEKLRGMFSLAIYDKNENKLLLARDHFGKKPLYFTKVQDTLIFGSELKSLREHPLCPKEIDKTSVAKYLVYEYIPSPYTIYKDIFKLRPGAYVTFDGRNLSENTYSSLDTKIDTYDKSYDKAKEELLEKLSESVKKRLVADVTVGVFLSGGLDSSSVAYFAQKNSKKQINTFSIGFEDSNFDESSYARDVAKSIGSLHHEKIITSADLLGLVNSIPEVLDEPIADSSIIPTLLLSDFTSKEVKVALGGDGADELLFGYDTFFAHEIGTRYEKIPNVVLRIISYFVHLLPVSHKYMSFDFKAKKFVSGFGIPKKYRNTYWLGAFSPEELNGVLNYDVETSSILESTYEIYKESDTFLNSLQLDYVRGYLAEDILVKVDRASMAHGLEVRAPFLDIDFAKFAISLPVEFKLKGKKGKRVLKDAMKGKLPQHIIDRPKKGFAIPIGSWIKGDLKDLFTKVLLEGKLVKSGLFKREALATLLEYHLKGAQDNRKKLWTLFVLALWMEKWHE